MDAALVYRTHRNEVIVIIILLLYRLFDGDYHWKKVHPIMKEGIDKRDFVLVGNSHNRSSGLGIVMNCGGVRCVFEFLSYEYVADAGKLQPAISESTFIATDV